MRLLFITQKINQDDDDLAFTILWVEEFIRQGYAVSVICLEKGAFDGSFPVYSLQKEKGKGKLARIFSFLQLITTLHYDRVFVHMNPEYFTLGGWWWFLRGIPAYLWYTHYTMTPHLFLAGIFSRRMFAATAQSLPQYTGNSKKVILGHGIDLSFWSMPEASEKNEHALLSVHRLSRSKRLERVINALALLPSSYTLTVYGRAVDQVYFAELQALVAAHQLADRVSFMGPVPMRTLKSIYPSFRIMVNMASETIDKTMLEGMLAGLFPVTTPENSKAIGLPVYPEDDSPEAIARFITSGVWDTMSYEAGRAIVRDKHSLPVLISRMSTYILPGT